MANEQNLIPNNMRSPSEVRENGRKGGIASGKKRRERRAFREAFDALLSKEFTDRNGKKVEGIEAIAARTFQAAMDGDLRAVQFIRDTVGEMPVQQMEIQAQIPQETYDRVARVLSGGDLDGSGSE